MKKIIKIILAVAILAIFIWTIIFLYQKSKDKPVVFETESPTITNIVKKTVATGSVVPRKEIEIKPQVSGIIQEIYVEAGQMIRKGDKIARVQIIPNMINLNNAETRVERAKLNLADTKIVYDRQKSLFDQKVIPEAEFQKAAISYNDAKLELNSAENNLDLIKEGATKRGGNQSNTIVRSTIDGMILDIPIKEGNSVIESNTFNAGTTVATIADMGEMIFLGTVDETEVGKIELGMKLKLSIGAIDNEVFDAELEYISPKGVEANGAIQFEIKAKVNLKDSQFVRAGYSANADIVLDKRDSVLALDESLIMFQNDSAFVEVEIKEQEYEKRWIETGLSDGINIEILSGITKDNKIKVVEKMEEKEEKKEE